MGTNTTWRFGAFELDERCRRLARNGEPRRVTPKAFELLVLLLAEAPRVVSKDEIHARIWPGTFVADATLVGLVKELRRTLEDRDSDAPILRTVHRVGYAMGVPVERGAVVTGGPSRHWIEVAGLRVPLRHGVNIVGRDPESDIWIDAPSVSRRHARITIDGSRAAIEDLSSKNGTEVRSRRITAPEPLSDGDRFLAGSVPLTYRMSSTGISTDTDLPVSVSRGIGSSRRTPPADRQR